MELENDASNISSASTDATASDASDLKTVSDYQLSQLDPNNPSKSIALLPPGNRDNPAQRQAKRQLALDAARSSLGAISALIGLSNPTLANQVRTVGTAGVQVGEAISKYLEAVESNQADGIASTALTGNLVMAGVQLFSVFSGTGSASPDQVIVGQLQQITEQIEALHKDMTARFDHVDATLNTILDQLKSDFDAIDYKLGVIRGDISQIQASLLDIQAELNRIEQYLLAYTSSVSKEQFVQTMNGCLGYWNRTGADIGFQQYQSCENAFYTWAYNTASDEIWGGVNSPDYSDSGVYSALTNFPLSVNVNLLAQYPAHGSNMQPLAGTRLSNPNEWALGARAYLQLALEWPQYVSQNQIPRLESIIQAGSAIQNAIRSVNSSGSGALTKANQSLLPAVSSKYSSAVNDLQSAVQSSVSTFLGDPSQKLQGVDLWGGASQPSKFIPPISVVAPPPGGILACSYQPSPSSSSADVPSGLLSQIPDVFRLSQSLGTGSLGLYATANWVKEASESCFPGGMLASLGVTLHATYNGQGVQSWSAKSQEKWTCPQTGDDPTHYLLCNWDHSSPCCSVPVRAMFENSVTVVPGANYQQVTTAAANDVSNALLSRQQSLYGQIAGQFSGALQKAGQELDSAKALVQSYSAFGLPSLVQSDERLHSLLYGDPPIPDHAAVQADFVRLSNSLANADVIDNKITKEIGELNAWGGAVSSALTRVLASVGQSQTPDSLSEVDVTLADLVALDRLLKSGASIPCSLALSSAVVAAAPDGGVANFSVQAPVGCAWHASTNASWLTVSSGQSGSSNGIVTVSVTRNDSVSPRSATAIVNDKVVRILQPGIGSSGSSVGPTSGTYEIVNRYSGKVLEDSGFSLQNGAPVGQWTYVGSPNQKWQVLAAEGSYFKVVNQYSGKALEDAGFSQTDGSPIAQYDYFGSPNQQWAFVQIDTNTYTIVNRFSGKVLEDSAFSIADGAPMAQYDYFGSPNQQWTLVRLGP